MKVLHVDDTPTERVIMKSYLKQIGHEVVSAENGQQAIELYQAHQPDLVLLDVLMPVMDGHSAARRIRVLDDEWVPIIFLSARISADDIAAGIAAGGDDYLTKPIDQTVLTAKMHAMQRIAAMRQRLLDLSTELEQANTELQRLVHVDGLTGLANRRHLDQHLAREVGRCARYRQPLSAIMIDIDHFKAYNDLNGHLAGDDCLKQVAGALKDVVKRPADLVARYGGEEFCMVLPDTPREGAVHVARRLAATIERLAIEHPANDNNQLLTLSIGVATCFPVSGFDREQLVQAADSALYRAKESGRNQIQVAAEAASA